MKNYIFSKFGYLSYIDYNIDKIDKNISDINKTTANEQKLKMQKEYKNINLIEPVTNSDSILNNIKESYKTSAN